VGLEQSSTGTTKVAVVLSCNDKGNKLALKQVQQYANTADLYQKTETIPITIDIPMLQALLSRFAQGPMTLDLDVYGSMILDVHCFYLRF
jgi:hypothetical protein